ncbi:hypothetical protein AKJ62_03430 [candidate division MSBL1 archaeon SCGC-AAA259D14]|nr:hypothetical protein AKJ62_03430 [candidate division MSBL1 archaeon SCGC-AAA259D14]
MWEIETNSNFERLEKVLTREEKPDRIPFYEHGSEIEERVLKEIDEEIFPIEEDMSEKEKIFVDLKNHVKHQTTIGYDYVHAGAIDPDFPYALEQGRAGVSLSEGSKSISAETEEGERVFQHSSKNVIGDWEDFEDYPWPEVDEMNFSPIEWAEDLIPDTMKVLSPAPGGVFEHLTWLVGFKKISFMLRDDEELLSEIVDKIGSILADYLEEAASFDAVGGIVMGDDLGFKSGTLISPEDLRKYIFPWHDEIVSRVHEHGKFAILHCCGNLRKVREDIIDCGWDAKHSFQDAIEPVWEAKPEYGGRLTVLGGFDMDKISRMDP